LRRSKNLCIIAQRQETTPGKSTGTMQTTAPPVAAESNRYLRLMRAAVGVRRHFDLLMWLQGDMQRYLPHEIMVAAWGDFHLDLVYHDIVSALPGVRTDCASSETLTPLLKNLFERWVASGRKPYALDTGEAGFLIEGGGIKCALGGALKEMRSALVHGISDERGRHDCLYVVFSSQPALGQPLARDALHLLLPYIDTALRQVEHLPRQHGQVVETEEPVPTGAGEDESSLSGREREIMEWVAKGKTNQEVAAILDISAFTVKNHLQRIFKKLGVFNRTQAVTRFERSATNGRN
jgi:transcriptional regulator EpsA